MNQIYPIQISDENGVTRETWAYTCGHCTTVIGLRPERSRPRVTCYGCGRWLCEKNKACMEQCTPIYSMAKDGFENVGKWGERLPEIMRGTTNG